MGTKTGESQVRSPLKTLYMYRPSGLVSSSTITRKMATCRTLLSVTGIIRYLTYVEKTLLKFFGHQQCDNQIDEYAQCDNADQDILQRGVHVFPSFFCYRRSQPSVKPINATNVIMVARMIITSST